MLKQVREDIDQIDAALGSGDAYYDPVARDLLYGAMRRWTLKLNELAEQARNDNSDLVAKIREAIGEDVESIYVIVEGIEAIGYRIEKRSDLGDENDGRYVGLDRG